MSAARGSHGGKSVAAGAAAALLIFGAAHGVARAALYAAEGVNLTTRIGALAQPCLDQGWQSDQSSRPDQGCQGDERSAAATITPSDSSRSWLVVQEIVNPWAPQGAVAAAPGNASGFDNATSFNKVELLDPWPSRSVAATNSSDSLARTVARSSVGDGLDIALLDPWASPVPNDYAPSEIIDPWARAN